MTRDQLQALVRNAGRTGVFYSPLAAAMAEFGIVGPAREAAFLAQVLHESGGLAQIVESLNYSSGGLQATFGGRLSLQDCARLGRQPGEACVPLARQREIASRIYGGRMGNAPAPSDDGWRYRGRGLIQITGRTNYAAASRGLYRDDRLLERPELLEGIPEACRSAAWWWREHGLSELADGGRANMRAITRTINGGFVSLAERLALYDSAVAALA